MSKEKKKPEYRTALDDKLKQFVLPTTIFETGEDVFDGHLEWKFNSKRFLVIAKEFREHVVNQDRGEVFDVLSKLYSEDSASQVLMMVDLLLEREAEALKEVLLCAIISGSRPAVELILQLFIDWPHEERAGCTNSDNFPPHITPLVLACLVNNFAIVECLLLRGHQINPIHKNLCACDVCQREPNCLMRATPHIDICRALASDAFLWLGVDDPFAAGCTMSKDMELFMDEDKMEYWQCYSTLQQNSMIFCANLVDQFWSSKDMDTLLSQKEYSTLMSCEDPYPRNQMALNSELREAISTPTFQKAAEDTWIKGWKNTNVTLLEKTFQMSYLFLYFILAPIYIFSNGRWAKGFEAPCSRFMANAASYFSFIMTLVMLIGIKNDMDESAAEYVYQIYLFSYVIGMIVDKQLLLARYGFHNYFQFWWRPVEMVMLFLFIFCFMMYAMILNTNLDDVHHTHRRHWYQLDTSIFYDMMVSITIIIACIRSLYFIQMKKSAGTVIISGMQCVAGLYHFLLMFVVIIVVFAISIEIVYTPYVENAALEGENVEPTSSHFADEFNSMMWLYWAFYGYTKPEDYVIRVGNIGEDFKPYEHVPTKKSISILVGLFHVLVGVALLNLMISTLCDKAMKIMQNEETEYLYVRLAVQTEFSHWTSAVPPPFNLLYIVKEYITRSFSGVYVFCWPDIVLPKDVLDPDPTLSTLQYVVYTNTMIRAFKRYCSTKEHHYRSVVRSDFGDENKYKPNVPKVAFMNDYETSDFIEERTVVLSAEKEAKDVKKASKEKI